MNAGGVLKVCKSNGADDRKEVCIVANGLVTRRNLPQSREQQTERSANTLCDSNIKGAIRFGMGLRLIS